MRRIRATDKIDLSQLWRREIIGAHLGILKIFGRFGLLQYTPANLHMERSSSSIRMSCLYLARRSDRHGAPVLIWPVRKLTTKSAMKKSSVSPDRSKV